LIGAKSKIGADGKNGLYTINLLEIFRADKGGGERSMSVCEAKMNGNGRRDAKEAANGGLFRHMVSHPMKEEFLGCINT
jgi:hypothetical protein